MLDSIRRDRARFNREHKQRVREETEIRKSIESFGQQQVQIRKDLITLYARKMYRCIWLRDNSLVGRLKKDCDNRQKAMLEGKKHPAQYQGSIKIFPVCARAYQDCLRRSLKPGAFIPTELHSGVPRLMQWIEESSFAEREKHLDALLFPLKRILNDVERWCSDQPGGKVQFSRVELDEMLRSSAAASKKQIDDIFKSLMDTIQTLVSMGDKETRSKKYAEIGYRNSLTWIKKFPEEESLIPKMTCMTYHAILRRRGGPYTARRDGTEYNWPRVMYVFCLQPHRPQKQN